MVATGRGANRTRSVWTLEGAGETGVYHAAGEDGKEAATASDGPLTDTYTDSFWKNLRPITDTNTNNVAFTAQWTPDVYAVTLSAPEATQAATPTPWERYGSGMYLDEDCTEGKRMSLATNGIVSPLRSYAIAYDANAGEASGITVPEGTTYSYEFTGFFTKQAGGTQVITADGRIAEAAQAGSYPITFHANPSVTVTATVHDRVVSNPETGTTIWANDPTVPRDLVDALLAGEPGALERFVEQAGIVAYDAEGNPVPIVRADLSQLRSEPGTYEVTLYTADGTAITVLVTVGVQQDGTVHQAVATLPKAPDTKAPDATESSAKSLPKTDDESPRSRSIAGMLAAALLSLVAGLVLRRKEQEEEEQCSAHRASNSAP